MIRWENIVLNILTICMYLLLLSVTDIGKAFLISIFGYQIYYFLFVLKTGPESNDQLEKKTAMKFYNSTSNSVKYLSIKVPKCFTYWRFYYIHYENKSRSRTSDRVVSKTKNLPSKI